MRRSSSNKIAKSGAEKSQVCIELSCFFTFKMALTILDLSRRTVQSKHCIHFCQPNRNTDHISRKTLNLNWISFTLLASSKTIYISLSLIKFIFYMNANFFHPNGSNGMMDLKIEVGEIKLPKFNKKCEMWNGKFSLDR